MSLNSSKFNSILSRLLISFLLMITPIMATGLIMFSWEKQAIKTQIKDAALDNVSFLQHNLENEIQNIKLLQYNLTNDLNLTKLSTQFANLPTYEKYTLIADVQRRLQLMKDSSYYITDVVVYLSGIGHTISVNKGYQLLNQDEYGRLLDMSINSMNAIIFDNNQMISLTRYPLSSGYDKPPLYISKVILSEEKIKKFMGKFSKYNVSDSALYDYTSKKWVFSEQSLLGSVADARLSLITDVPGVNTDTIVTIDGSDYYVISVYSKDLNASFVQYVFFEDIFKVLNRYSLYIWIYSGLSIVIIIYSFSTYRFLKRPINTILKAFGQVEKGDLSVQVQAQPKAASEFNYLFEGFNNMVFRLNELVDNVYKQELYLKKAELKQLQSQINPHFLYNSYFVLHRLITYRDLENAELLSSYLGSYFQFVTRNASDEVTLQNELEHARSYAHIQQMRFSRWLSIELGEVPEKYCGFFVPRMILQPILENSMEHGFKTAMKDGLIRLQFTDTETGFFISVEDSGQSISDTEITALRQKLTSTDDEKQITGIINVHRRIVLKYGAGSGIKVSRSALGGLRVEIHITQ